jgi:hypothetical protein
MFMRAATIEDWKSDLDAYFAGSWITHELRQDGLTRYSLRTHGRAAQHTFSASPVHVVARPGDGGPNIFLEAAHTSERWMLDRADYHHRLLPVPDWTVGETPKTSIGKVEKAYAGYHGGELDAITLGSDDWDSLRRELEREPDENGDIVHKGIRVRKGASLRYIIRPAAAGREGVAA